MLDHKKKEENPPVQGKRETTCLFEDGNVHEHNQGSFEKVRKHLENE